MFYSNVESKLALMTAVSNGWKDIAQSLIASGASVHVVNNQGYTPLHMASLKGHRDIVELLIANGVPYDARAEDDCTPLYLAAWGKHREVVQLLLDCGANMEPDMAVMLGDIELVKHYLERGLDPNSRLTKGLTKGTSWLNTAIGCKNRNLIEMLLDRGARVNERTGRFKFAPLHQAAIGIRGIACRDICELLIARGADVNLEDKFGNTPLHLAAKLEHNDIVELLLDCNVNVNALDIEKRSALFEAARLNKQQIVKSLLSRGAEVNLMDKLGFTPLLCAFQRQGSDEIIRLLVAYGADVNVRFPQGNTPLQSAVLRNNNNLVELLLAHGARYSL